MNFLCKAQTYLRSVTTTVSSLCGMICSDELKDNIDAQYQIAVTMIELEQATSEFIQDIGLDSEVPQSVAISKRRFMLANARLIKHAEKIQLQGYRFDELITTLKLENETLKEECNFL